MTTICPNCKREDTASYDSTWCICMACGHRGNPSAFGYDIEKAIKEDFPEPKPKKTAKKVDAGDRVHTMYLDDDGNTVVSDEW